MKAEKVKEYLSILNEAALDNKGTKVNRVVRTPEGVVYVEARSNRIGFVYWYFDGKPLPRKRLQGVLERPEVKPEGL